jgi:hypothetical protein
MGWIRCDHSEKLQCDFVARTFVLIAPVQYVLHQLSCTYKTIPNAPKYYETHRNISLGSKGADWVRSFRKIATWLRGTNFCINCTSSVCFATCFMQLRNDPKCTEIQQNGVDWVGLWWKIPTWLRGPKFCINCTSSAHFAPSFIQLWNDPKCTQTLWNTPKQKFRVQWGGSSAFVVKNYNVTSWHELLY